MNEFDYWRAFKRGFFAPMGRAEAIAVMAAVAVNALFVGVILGVMLCVFV